jgi:hypothetical protein
MPIAILLPSAVFSYYKLGIFGAQLLNGENLDEMLIAIIC